MPTTVDVVNAALIKLGEKTIVSIDDDRKAARIAKATFDEHRDYVVQDHTWNFAVTRIERAAGATDPAFGYEYAYPLDPDELRVIELSDAQGERNERADWKVESVNNQRAVVTDETPPLRALVIKRVTDLDRTTPMFRDALATYCAYQWAEAMTGTQSKTQELLGEYTRKISTARSNDGREGTLDKAFIRNSWLDNRNAFDGWDS